MLESTYTYDGEINSSGETYMSYIPTNRGEPIPSPSSLEDVNIPYYYVYSYQTIIDMLNNALIEAYSRLQNICGFHGINLPSQNVPYFELWFG